MKIRPILFSKPMVRALLAGTKTQTRRIVKPRPPADQTFVNCLFKPSALFQWSDEPKPEGSRECVRWPADHGVSCKYGAPGDLLWVRETWAWPGEEEYLYRADPGAEELVAAWCADPLFPQINWKPSIHMPRLASRITLRVTDVRVEQLQSISVEDARAEGMSGDDPVADYRLLWEVINAPGAWCANPYVWAISFEVIVQNVERVAA